LPADTERKVLSRTAGNPAQAGNARVGIAATFGGE